MAIFSELKQKVINKSKHMNQGQLFQKNDVGRARFKRIHVIARLSLLRNSTICSESFRKINLLLKLEKQL